MPDNNSNNNNNSNDNSAGNPPRTLGEEFLRTLWIFQGIAALPIFLILGFLAVVNLFSTYERLYDFITHFTCTILSAGILYIVYVQRILPTTTRLLTLRFEVTKSALASVLWLWLLLDAIFGPKGLYYRYDRKARIQVAIISVVLLPLLYYSTVWYALRKLRASRSKQGATTVTDVDGERSPLLAEQGQV
ncbi:hypothetical protein BX600DRAFT_470624 [Xylariales sp. PMI_506]|nr:hypothetical protein BX600DRAFT_470624 [Xylariales sp. PMI_506]